LLAGQIIDVLAIGFRQGVTVNLRFQFLLQLLVRVLA
jgi:hypothetical protein